MYVIDIISKKRDGKTLTKEEIDFVLENYINGNIKDYQMSAFLMAVYLKGMNYEETYYMTDKMKNSGDIVDFSKLKENYKLNLVDKHSTGGVGDKITLIVLSILGASGIKTPKMSGKGLGFTGGTIDKLLSINNLKVEIPESEFINIVNEAMFSIISQTKNVAPMDKAIYALRDVTGTVSSIPLIASSIMSKKLAFKEECLLLDVKLGSGAFMKNLEDAVKLSKYMVEIGDSDNRKVLALITSMDKPLGRCIGNSLEVLETLKILSNNESVSFNMDLVLNSFQFDLDLYNLAIKISAYMMYLANFKEEKLEIKESKLKEYEKLCKEVVKNKSALKTFLKVVKSQGGNMEDFIEKTKVYIDDENFIKVKSNKSGYIGKMDVERLGLLSCKLGAGRLVKDEEIDYEAGIVIEKTLGDYVYKDQVIGKLYKGKGKKESNEFYVNEYLSSIEFQNEKPSLEKSIKGIVYKDCEEIF